MSDSLAIEAVGLAKAYGRTRALAGLDLEVGAGEILGVLGPNGAGKTTAVRVLTTLLRPDRGTARVAGYDVVTEAALVRREIGLTGQYAALDECLTGRANLVMVGQLGRLSGRQVRPRAWSGVPASCSWTSRRPALTRAAGWSPGPPCGNSPPPAPRSCSPPSTWTRPTSWPTASRWSITA